ncbi:MAG: DUF4115 domain-containing protein [Gammaproteobacteria bacterium]|nr:DUF4115 domain-containing protein [Gammaproteobacteria bacterium]
MPVDEPATVDTQDPGAALRAARDAAGLSVPDVAQRLKLTVRLVEAIEANDRKRFPPAVYLRGFVRNYAKLLGLEAEPLVEAFAMERPTALELRDERPRRTPLSFLSELSIGELPPAVVMGTVGGLAVMVLIVLLYWLWPVDQGPEPQDATVLTSPIDSGPGSGAERSAAEEEEGSTEVESTAVEAGIDTTAGTRSVEPGAGETGGPDTTDPLAAEPGGLPSPASPPSEAAAGSDAPDAVAAEAGGSGNVAPADDGAQVTEATGDPVIFSRLTPVGDEELLFGFTEDCWVEIFDTEGEILYQDLMRRRQTLRLVGAGPFQIRLGYAPAVTLAYNGEPVPLAPHTRNTVALLVVGQ